ncbi:MAG: hypothetical protein SVC26_07035 [Pseudomonadota bacterium]|nr:hypothetical protein [Pseudomonadota bacterium]
MSMKKFADMLEHEINLVTQKITVDLHKDLVMTWPVGNPDLWKSPYAPAGYVGGRSRMSWDISVTPKPKFAPLSTSYPVPASTLPQLSKVYYITNGAPYAQRLNQGHSTQMPSGTVDRLVEKHSL